MRTLFSLLAASMVVVSVAEARETGDIRGQVTDADGLGVPGAEIVLSGADLAGEKRITTDSDGNFRFDFLDTGTYLVTVWWEGRPKISAQVGVNAEKSTWVPFEIDLTSSTEVVEVVSIQPVIDTTTSSVSHTLGQGYLQNMPVGRSYQDVVATLPGVYGRVDTSSGGGGDGNPSVRGEGQAGNSYSFDGVSTRDPATKTFGQSLNFDAIQEVQVYTDGAPAEFGQFTGMAVNVEVKDGGDEHHGSAALFYSQHAYVGKEAFQLRLDPGSEREVLFANGRSWSPTLNLTAGGPLLKEKLWYFLAADADVSLFQGSKPCTEGDGTDFDACKEASKSDAWKAERKTAQSNSYSGQVLAKLTWFPIDTVKVSYMFKGDMAWSPKENAGDPAVSPEADTNRKSMGQFHLLTAKWVPDDKTELVFRAGYNGTTLDIVPVSGSHDLIGSTDQYGVNHNNATNFDLNDRIRAGGGLVFNRRFEGISGSHNFKIGSEYWYLKETRDLQWTGETTINWIDQSGTDTGVATAVGTEFKAVPTAGYNCLNPDGSDCGIVEYHTNVGPLGTKAHTWFGFIQDDWTPVKPLTFNVGLRFDMEDGRNDANKRPTAQYASEFALPAEERTTCPEGTSQKRCTLGPLFMTSPRIGMAWDITKDHKTKFSAFYGWFYDLSGADFWQWANTQSSDGFVRYRRNASGDLVWASTQDPVGSPLIYDKKAHPSKQEMVVVSLEREVVDLLAVGVRGIFRRTNGLLEDVDVDFNNWYVMNAPNKQRFYRGLEIWVEKRWDEVWQALVSYSLSESWGHSPGQNESASNDASGSNGNNVGVYLDEIGEASVRQGFMEGGPRGLINGFGGLGHYSVTDPTYNNDAGWLGYLPYHSFHMVKANVSYKMPWGTKIGAVYEFDSGHAWQKRTFVPYYGYSGLAQGRGGRFMPAAHYLDVRVAHQFEFRNEQSLELSFDIFNLPGFMKPISYWENDSPGFGSVWYRQSPRSIRLGVKYRW